MQLHDLDNGYKFECDECGKKFRSKSYIFQHMKQGHLDVKPFECPHLNCLSKFKQESLLTTHIRGVHENAFKDICPICAKVFKSKNQCEKHQQLEHSDKKLPRVECHLCGER